MVHSRVLAKTLLLRSSFSGQSTALDDFLQRVLLPTRLLPSSCSSPISFFHAQIPARCHHQSPMTHRTLHQVYPSINSRISGIHQLDACTGCSCKKCLPMINCPLYTSIHARVYCLSWSCILRQFGSSFHKDRATCGRRCMARYQSRVAFAPIFLCPLSFRGPRIVRRHVLLSDRQTLLQRKQVTRVSI